MKKFVFIDIDGTLFDYKHRSVPQSAKEALRRAKANGHELFICTGRVKEMVESSYLELPISGAVFACGAHIIAQNKTIYETCFPRKELDELIDYFLAHGIEFSLEGKEISFFSEKSMEMYMSYFGAKGSLFESGRKFLEGKHMKKFSEMREEDYNQVLKVAFQSPTKEVIQPCLDALAGTLEYFIYSDSISGNVEGEILIHGVDKAAGIDHVLKYFHGNIEDTIAIGDSDNDISMVEHAHIGIAMGNACDNLKEKADYITADISDDGLYKAFEHFKLI